ncbi:MAG: hypothetical protein HIU88_03345 [Acidobacteria bacterium]|nr:hypothetical protein [Acidobacteriota bacterium]
MRPHVGVSAIAAAAVALAVALTGCTAVSPPARVVPNRVEQQAVQAAGGDSGAGPVGATIPWVQLWTLDQFPQQMKECAGKASYGQLAVNAGPLPTSRVEYQIIGSGSHPNEVESGQIIDACRAQTPVDDRMLRLPMKDAHQLYSYDLTVLRPCLIAHGFDVSLPPSRQSFEALLRAHTPWSPYDHVVVTNRLAWYALSDACPAIPAEIAAAIPTA